jgi:hypothetical protein
MGRAAAAPAGEKVPIPHPNKAPSISEGEDGVLNFRTCHLPVLHDDREVRTGQDAVEPWALGAATAVRCIGCLVRLALNWVVVFSKS